MTKLTETQAGILAAAADRPDRNLLPLPGSLRGGAAAKVAGALIARGLAAETVAEDRRAADPALNRFWRNEADGQAVLLHLTEAGLIAAREATAAAESPAGGQGAVATHKDAGATEPAPRERATRPGTKQARLIDMLRSEAGATVAEIAAATGWQPHTVRGALAGALKKRLGLEATSEKVGGRGRVYRLPPA